MNLFNHADKYPNSAGYAKGSETSKEAAQKLTSREIISESVLHLVDAAAQFGITVDEARIRIENMLDKDFERSTIAARFSELTKQGTITIAGKRDNDKGRKVNYYISS